MKLFGRKTNRQLILKELKKMDAERFAVVTGLVFNEEASRAASVTGKLDYAAWLNSPATTKRIFAEV